MTAGCGGFLCFDFNDDEKGLVMDSIGSTHCLPLPSSQLDRIRDRGAQVRDAAPLGEKKERELIELKLQIATQNEDLGLLSSKLRRREVEIEAIKAEKTSLIDELARARSAKEEQSTSTSSSDILRIVPKRFSLRGFGAGVNDTAASPQTLTQANAKLRAENSRLQISADGMHQSFQSHITCSQRSSRADKETIESLQRQNEVLRQQLKLAEGKHTGWAIEGVDIEAEQENARKAKFKKKKKAEEVGRERCKELLVEFGEPRGSPCSVSNIL